MSYHVDVIPNRNSPPAILFREGKRIRRATLANLSKLPPEIVDGIRALPHCHVAALLGLAR